MKETTLIRRTTDLNIAKVALQKKGSCFTEDDMLDTFHTHRIPTTRKFVASMIEAGLLEKEKEGVYSIPRKAPFCHDHILKVFDIYMKKIQDVKETPVDLDMHIDILKKHGYLIVKPISSTEYTIV